MPVISLRGPQPTAAAPDALLTLDEAAAYLQIARNTLKHWVAERRIEHIKVGKYTRIRRAALDRWIDAQTVTVRVELPE